MPWTLTRPRPTRAAGWFRRRRRSGFPVGGDDGFEFRTYPGCLDSAQLFLEFVEDLGRRQVRHDVPTLPVRCRTRSAQALMTRWSSPPWTSIFRGLAFSATGISSLRTPPW